MRFKCDKLNYEFEKHAFALVDYGHLLTFAENETFKPFMVIVQYVKLNFREILPGTLVYLRTMFYIYAREDSLTISRRSKNSNVICSGCFDEVCGADLLDQKRTKLKKNIKELKDDYDVITRKVCKNDEDLIQYYNY